MYKNYIKRFLDVFFVLILIVPLLVTGLIISLLIKLDSKGNVLFKQERLGKNLQVFEIYKFRTMIEDAEGKGSGIYTSKGDPRITKVGKFLRKTSLDELPQLINVIKGDMSIVGPRPPVPYHPYKINEYPEARAKRFEVRPGITGLAQVSGRNNLTWDERIDYDVKYVAKHSCILDFKIIFLTIVQTLSSKNIYSK